MTLSIIILSYNTKDLFKNCLKSVFKNLKDFDFEVIVVDNDSHDGSPEMVENEFKKVKLIRNKENVGFGSGNNVGAKQAKGKYLLFLNSDTEVLDNGFLKMTKYLDSHSKAGVLGGKMQNSDGSPQSSAGYFFNVFNTIFM